MDIPGTLQHPVPHTFYELHVASAGNKTEELVLIVALLTVFVWSLHIADPKALLNEFKIRSAISEFPTITGASMDPE